MLKVELADPAITLHGWLPAMDSIGSYSLRVRKTPEEMKAEKERLKKDFGGNPKVSPIRFERGTVIEHAEDDPTTAYILPGLWPRVKGWMEDHGIEYEITADYRDPELRPQIDFDAIKDVQFRETQDLALALVATADCGIIATTTSYGKSFLVGVICKAFPTLRILVCTSSTMVVSTLYEYLCKQVPGEVGIIKNGKDTSHNKRVVVSTLRSINKIPPEGPQLVICDECHDVGATKSGQDLMKFCFARRFGLTASPIRNDGSAIVMESIFGPIIMTMTYEEAQEAGMVTPMKYTMLKCNWVPNICHNLDLNEVLMKRYGYWQNTVRNRTIAKFVNEVHQANREAQILIIVATLEHAIALHQHLPWFKVASYGGSDLKEVARHFKKEKYPDLNLSQYKMTQKQLDIMRAAFAKGTLRFVISTLVFRQGVSFDNLRVLVRADGATSEIMGIQIPGRLARLHEGKDYGYLIDITDEGCVWTEKRAICREGLYKRQNWTKIKPEDVIHDLSATASVNSSEDTGSEDTEKS